MALIHSKCLACLNRYYLLIVGCWAWIDRKVGWRRSYGNASLRYSYVFVPPPNKIRSTENDHTIRLMEIILVNSLIRTALQSREDIHIQIVSNHHPKRTNPVINRGRNDEIICKLWSACTDSSLLSLQRYYSDLKPIRRFYQSRSNIGSQELDSSGEGFSIQYSQATTAGSEWTRYVAGC